MIKKVRKSTFLRNFTPLQNPDKIDVWKVYPPYDIKGAFMEEGGMNDDFLYVGFDTEYYFNKDNKLEFLTYQLWINDYEEGILIVSEKGEKIGLRDLLLLLQKIYKVKNIVFIAHFGVVDYLKLSDFKEFVKFCRYNQKTIFGSFNYKFYDNNRNLKSFDVKIKDSMLLSGGGSLKNLGKTIGIEKIDIGNNISRMKEFYYKNRDEFIEYAMNDSIIAVKFYKYLNLTLDKVFQMDRKEIIGVNTASGIGELFFKKMLKINEVDKDEFVGKSKIKNVYWNNKLKKLMKFVKVDFDSEMKYWEKGYYGGRNETFITGMYQKQFYDYDIKNAYPLAMLSIQDVDWQDRVYLKNNNIYSLDFNDIGFIYLDFEFKEDVKYPLFPIKTDYGLIFPKSGKTIVSIPEFLTALNNKLLKDYYIRDGIKFVKKKSLTIPSFTKMVIDQRAKYEKGSLENTLWKLVANSFYGKTAQGLTNKKSLDLEKSVVSGEKIYKKIGKSSITNAFISGYITGVVRALVGEYMNYFSNNDVNVVNVTTDGFMVDTQLLKNELEGVGYLTKKFSAIRYKWLDDKQILELKHFSNKNSRNVVIKTRGYWLEPVDKQDVVLIARGGIQTKGVEKNYTDNFKKQKAVYNYLTKSWLNSDYNSEYLQNSLKNLGDVLIGDVEDIINYERIVSMNFDFDFKRKPFVYKDQEIFFEKEIFNKLKIIETKPWESVEEFLQFKNAYEKFNKAKTNVNKIQNKYHLEKFFEYVRLEKYADTRVNKLEQVVLTKIINVLLLEGYGNKEIADILNIKVKQVEKRKYSKSFKKIKSKGIKKISEKEYIEDFYPFLKEFGLSREIILLIKDKIVLKEDSEDISYFEIVDKIKDLKDF